MTALKSTAFFEAVAARRSNYALTNKTTLTPAQLKDIVEKAVKHAPTSFNGQQSRAVLVAGKKHQEVWDTVLTTFLKTLGGDKEKEALYTKKINENYRAGFGTVIFFEDQDIINGFAAKLPPFAQLFPVWSDNSAGILQHIVWTALTAEGHGANLQHYGQFSPETQADVNKLVDAPPSWKITALLPFGVPSAPPSEKAFAPVEERTKFFFDEE
ncbi:hypothetical protein IAT38_002481 [Cryptococcus sp. DSM 104549]